MGNNQQFATVLSGGFYLPHLKTIQREKHTEGKNHLEMPIIRRHCVGGVPVTRGSPCTLFVSCTVCKAVLCFEAFCVLFFLTLCRPLLPQPKECTLKSDVCHFTPFSFMSLLCKGAYTGWIFFFFGFLLQ